MSATVGIAALHHEAMGDLRAFPPVLLLHGLGSSSQDWALQRSVLTAHYPVLVVDLPGHGRSGPTAPGTTVEAMADSVHALLVDLGAAPAHVMGLSLGGCVALALALRTPARVRTLTLVNSFPRLVPAGARGVGRILRRLALLAVAPMPVVAGQIARELFPDPAQDALRAAAVQSLSRCEKRSYVSTMRALARFDVRPRLGSIACPTLVVAGARDATVPLAVKRRLAAGIPGARLLVIDDSGHATPYDAADALSRAMLEFIAVH